MKRNYLIEAFQKTTARDFPAQKAQLNAAMEKRLEELRRENAGASPPRRLCPGRMPGAVPLFLRQPYDGMHPKLLWHRTKTLGRGDDCCDFCLKLIQGEK